MNKTHAEIYIHIPFCVRKCNYCDFLSFAADDAAKELYVDALLKEIRTWQPANDYIIDTIFIGGGTPSILNPCLIEKIVEQLYHSFTVSPDAEISMECNPGTLTKEKLSIYYKTGISRLSIGLQSTDNACLKILGRIHTFEEFVNNYSLARETGFTNINIDLMSALPGQSLSSYLEGLHLVTGLAPEHISSYSLILEEGTPFFENDAILSLLPDEDTDRSMYEATKEILAKSGYERYEISNYAKEGRACRHNLGYWSDVPYIGFGLGSASYLKDVMPGSRYLRYNNTSDLKTYLAGNYVDPDTHQFLSLSDRMEEYMFLGLRRMSGISVSLFLKKFGRPMTEVYGDVIKKYTELNYLVQSDDYLRLTDAGIDISNHIFSEFLLS